MKLEARQTRRSVFAIFPCVYNPWSFHPTLPSVFSTPQSSALRHDCGLPPSLLVQLDSHRHAELKCALPIALSVRCHCWLVSLLFAVLLAGYGRLSSHSVDMPFFVHEFAFMVVHKATGVKFPSFDRTSCSRLTIFTKSRCPQNPLQELLLLLRPQRLHHRPRTRSPVSPQCLLSHQLP